MMLQSSDNYTKALVQLTTRFKFVFPANFRAGFKDIVSTKGKGKLETQYYFSFQSEKQAIFAFFFYWSTTLSNATLSMRSNYRVLNLINFDLVL